MANGLLESLLGRSARLRPAPQGVNPMMQGSGSLPAGYNIPDNLGQLGLPNRDSLRMPMGDGLSNLRMTPMQDVGFQASQAQPQAQPTEQPKGLGQRAKGILGSIGSFLSNPDTLDNLAIGFGGMSLNPNQALMQQAAGRIENRQELAITQGDANKTIEYFRSVGRDDLAQAVATNPEMAKALLAQYINSTLTTDKKFRPLTPSEVEIAGYDPSNNYQIDSEGRVYTLSSGGTTINMPNPPESTQSWALGYARNNQEALDANANQSSTSYRNMELINTLMGEANLNVVQRVITQNFPGLAATLDYSQGIPTVVGQLYASLVPLQRPEGSGTTSDRDMALYERALGGFLQSPQAAALALEIYKAKADLDQEIKNVNYRISSEQISPEEGRRLLTELGLRHVITPEIVERIQQFNPSFQNNESPYSDIPTELWNSLTPEQQNEINSAGDQ